MTAETTRPAMGREAVLRRVSSPDVEYVEIDGETVVYDSRSRHLHVLNPVGSLVWILLDGEASLGQTSEELAGAFAQEPDEVFGVVRAFAEQLVESRVAERVL